MGTPVATSARRRGWGEQHARHSCRHAQGLLGNTDLSGFEGSIDLFSEPRDAILCTFQGKVPGHVRRALVAGRRKVCARLGSFHFA